MTRRLPGQSRAAVSLRYVFCGVVSFVILVPVWIAFTAGFKDMGQLVVDPIGVPNPAQLQQFQKMLTGEIGTYWLSLLNSVIVASLSVILVLVICTMAAFVLARMRFRLNGLVYNYFLLGLLFPLVVAILPLYIQIRNLGLLDNYLGVVLPQVAFQIPLTIVLLRGFFRSIPKDLEDACEIDGYGPFGFLVHMVIPLSTPILATSGVLTLVQSWNNFFLPLLVFNNQSRATLPLGVMVFQGQYASQWNNILGYLSLAMIPAVLIFVFAQKYIVAGLTAGAVKG